MNELTTLLDLAIAAAFAAGRAIMEVYAGPVKVELKDDRSPLTEADRQAHEAILHELAVTRLPVLSEEGKKIPVAERQGWERYWLVDPLDGTKEFIKRNGEFTVNIALVVGGEPVLGVVYAPALGRMFLGARGVGAFVEDADGRRSIACRAVPDEGLTVVASRSHGDAEALDRFLAGRKVAALKSAGSSLKLCLVAAGEADLYPRFGRTMEWDTAAGQAVLEAAGGSVRELSGKPLLYGKTQDGFRNPSFVARGR